MKKILLSRISRRLLPFSLTLSALACALLGNVNKASAQNTRLCPLPDELTSGPVTFKVRWNNGHLGPTCSARNDSYFRLTVSGAGGGTYKTWCSDAAGSIFVAADPNFPYPNPCNLTIVDHEYTATVYDSLLLSCPAPQPANGIPLSLYNPGLGANPEPNCLNVAVPVQCVWNQINYLLNHKVGTDPDAVQAAIWDLISPPGPAALSTLPSFSTSPSAQAALDRCAMFTDAFQNGSAFVPGPGQIRAAIFYVPDPDETIQFIFVEIPCPPCETEPPVITCPKNIDLGCVPQGTAIPDCDLSLVTTADTGSGIKSVTCSSTDSNVGCAYTRTITYTAIDNCGNKNTCTQTIIWKLIGSLTLPPKPQNFTGVCDRDVPAKSSLTATDSCLGSITVSPVDSKVFDTQGCGYTITRTWSFTRPCGPGDSIVQTIRINIAAPQITKVPTGIDVGCNSLPSDADVKALVEAKVGNCADPEITVTHADTVADCKTTRTFTITVTGKCGNPATATVVFTRNCPCGEVKKGDTATIGFWHNKNGQALITGLNGGATSKNLATWLASNFPYLYGANAGANNLTGKSNADVAALFLKFFGVQGQKTDAQILAVALAVYITDSDLAGNNAIPYGFNVSTTGTGAKTYNVGSNGTAIGLSNNTSYTVLQLLQQANLMKQLGTFNANAFNTIFDGINQKGDI